MKKLLAFFIMLTVLSCYTEAQIIGATNRSGTSNPSRQSNSPEYRPTGASLRFSTGFPNEGLIAFNYQITPFFLVGVGSGINVYDDDPAIPIFGELELRTPRYKWSLFYNVKMGYAIVPGYSGDLFFATMLGFGYKNVNIGFGISTGYDYHYHYGYYYDYGSLDTEWLPMVSLSYNLPINNLKKAFF